MPDNALQPRLDVYLRQDLVGRLWLDERGRFAFQYEPAWLNAGNPLPLSLSLPLKAEPYLDDSARPFFSNLLPEAGIRQTLARRLKISEQNDFELLRKIGGECAGAVSVLPGGKAPALAPGYREIDEEELHRVVKELPRRPFLVGDKGSRLSLAGAQNKLPVMLCPRWIDTPGEPIAVRNVVEYIVGCLKEPATAGGNFDIGGPDIITYRQLMLIYARVRGLKRLVLSVPVLTPYLSSFWINLMTPVPAGVVMPLVEALKNKVVCRDHRIRELVPLRLISMQEAICEALTEISEGPGKLPSRQACFLD